MGGLSEIAEIIVGEAIVKLKVVVLMIVIVIKEQNRRTVVDSIWINIKKKKITTSSIQISINNG